MATAMTYEEWQQTGKEMTCAEATEEYGNCFFEQSGCQSVMVYEGASHIEKFGQKKYHLMIYNQEWESEDLAELEKILWENHAKCEVGGICEDGASTPAIVHETDHEEGNAGRARQGQRLIQAYRGMRDATYNEQDDETVATDAIVEILHALWDEGQVNPSHTQDFLMKAMSHYEAEVSGRELCVGSHEGFVVLAVKDTPLEFSGEKENKAYALALVDDSHDLGIEASFAFCADGQVSVKLALQDLTNLTPRELESVNQTFGEDDIRGLSKWLKDVLSRLTR